LTFSELDPDAVGEHPFADVDELQAARENASAAMARTERVFFTGQVWG
jgi:flagellar biosynthesis regulator FlaF